MFLIGSFFCFKLNKNAIIVGVFISLPLIVLYSIVFKGLPLIGNIITSLILSLSFIFCGVAFDNISHMITPALLAFGLTLLREIIKDISTAREHGDLSENAEYHAAKEKQSFLEGRITELESVLSRSAVSYTHLTLPTNREV